MQYVCVIVLMQTIFYNLVMTKIQALPSPKIFLRPPMAAQKSWVRFLTPANNNFGTKFSDCSPLESIGQRRGFAKRFRIKYAIGVCGKIANARKRIWHLKKKKKNDEG